jgi:hypothetical protein
VIALGGHGPLDQPGTAEIWSTIVLMLRSVGLFHFVSEDKSDPIRSLQAALLDAGARDDLAESLIVLPEAFNLGRGYWSSEGSGYLPGIPGRLQGLASELGTAFVAGLLVNAEPADSRLPLSAAYLIDKTQCLFLGCKRGADSNAEKVYRAHKEPLDHPQFYKGFCVAALLCMDCTCPLLSKENWEATQAHHQVLREKIDGMGAIQTILCVPAHMNSSYSSEGIARRWPDQHFVLANSDPWGCASVIRIGKESPEAIDKTGNTVVVRKLAHTR